MGIKVTTTEPAPKPLEKPFPKLMQLKEHGGLFLFINENQCLCLEGVYDKLEGIWRKGEFWKDTNIDFFTDYNEPITIQNE